MRLRITSNDVDLLENIDITRNDKLHEFIRVYKTTKSIDCFQIELPKNITVDAICSIINDINSPHFLKTEFKSKDEETSYWLCFYKK